MHSGGGGGGGEGEALMVIVQRVGKLQTWVKSVIKSAGPFLQMLALMNPKCRCGCSKRLLPKYQIVWYHWVMECYSTPWRLWRQSRNFKFLKSSPSPWVFPSLFICCSFFSLFSFQPCACTLACRRACK